jgi:hypothetical protein
VAGDDDAPWWAQTDGGPPPSWWSDQPAGGGWQSQPPPSGMPFAAHPDPAYHRTQAPRPMGRAKGAVAALVWGILAVACCGLIGGGIALYYGSQARYRVRASNGRLGGDGLALAGMILGGLGIAETVIGIFLAVTGHRYGLASFTTTTTTP